MQFGDALCYALLTITMAATCIQAEIGPDEGEKRTLDRRSSRRVTTLFADSTPIESMIRNPSKVIYKRLSRKRHAPPKSFYGPSRPKYGIRPVKIPGRKPDSKFRSKHNMKHGRPTHQSKRSPKPRYGPPKPKPKPTYGPSKQKRKPTQYGPPKTNTHRPHSQHDNSGFAEPPPTFNYKHRPNNNVYFQENFDNESPKEGYANANVDLTVKPNFEHEFSSPGSYYFQDKPVDDSSLLKPQFNDYQNPKQDYGEPPVDSYGAPIKPNLHDLTFPTTQTSLDSSSNFYNNHNSDSDSVPNYTKNIPKYSRPDEVYVTPLPEDEELDLNSYSDIFNYRETKNKMKKNKGSYYENVKMVNRPWKNKMKEDPMDDVLVGGQYAEPPARYVPNFHSNAPVHIRDHDNGADSPPLIFSDPDSVSSATISSYVNYKNSNMAFSPQNLNDVFSIVDK